MPAQGLPPDIPTLSPPTRGSTKSGKLRYAVAAALLISVVTTTVSADAAPVQDFVLEQYSGSYIAPVDIAWAPNGLLFVAEKHGVIKVVDNGAVSTFIDIRAEVNSVDERGLLGIAVHPDFLNGSPYVYASYTYDPPETQGNTGNSGPDGSGQRNSRVSRIQAQPNTGFTTAVPGSLETIVGNNSTWATTGDPTADDSAASPLWSCGVGPFEDDCLPADARSHTIGTILFGPDGMLYVGNGEASNFEAVEPRSFRSLDVNSLAGKILRVDPDTGEGLSDNPNWDGDRDSNASKVFYSGLRNPFRFAINAAGEVWIGDVGGTEWEEINQAAPGADFGWPCYEGGAAGSLATTPGFRSLPQCVSYYASNSAVAPRFSYPRQNGAVAVIAGDFYTGTEWPVEFHGSFIVGDFLQGWLKGLRTGSTPIGEVPLATDILSVASKFGPDGHLYLTDISTGSINRIRYQPTASPPGRLRVRTSPATPSTISVNGIDRSQWSLDWLSLPSGNTYEVCFSDNPTAITPPCVSVDVNPGATTSVVGAFDPAATLVVTTRASGAPPGGVRSLVSVNGVGADEWGLIATREPGPVEVCFGPVANFTPPPCQNLVLESGVTHNVEGLFDRSPGAPGPTAPAGLLRVRISPAVPATILLDGVRLKEWSLDWVPTALGSHVVCFSDVPGYATPACEPVFITQDGVTEVVANFEKLGTLRVITNPATDVPISVDGVVRNQWGLWSHFSAGTYFVCAEFAIGRVCDPAVGVVAGAQTTVVLSP